MSETYAWVCIDCDRSFDDYVVARRHDRRHQVITVRPRSQLIVSGSVLAQPLGPPVATNLGEWLAGVRDALGRRRRND